MKALRKLLIILIIFAIVIMLSGYFYLNSKTPERDQSLIINGLSSLVEVIYDDYGVPHIYAENDADMYRAFGYVHAQDRLFQMELLRRLGEGRLAEIFGKEALKIDTLFRTIQINRYTKKWMEGFSKTGPQAIITAIDAYLAGINEFITSGPTPIEFEILGVDKSAFTREDMAAVMGFTAYSFTFGMTQDLLISNLLQELSDSYIEDLGIRWQEGSNRIPVNKKGLASINEGLSSVIAQLQPLGIFQGSNGWAIAPERTQSGKAMLANDPHMGLSQPSVWYEAHLVSPESEIYGHHLALVPFAFLGHNEDIAWGLTMFINDDIDLFKETLNPEDPDQYWAIDEWLNFEHIEETIQVKDEKDVVLKLKKSRHGPIINDAFSEFDGTGHNATDDYFNNIVEPLSMWWTFYQDGNDLFSALYDLTRVKNVEQAAQAVTKIASPGLNVMYADKQGDIAWWAAAKLVKRPAHVNSSTILDGASGKDDPLGFYDFSANPQILNPDSGVLYSSNNQPMDSGIGLVPGYYVSRDRAQRIEHYLFSDEKNWDASKIKSMLLDNTSPTVKKVQDVTLPSLSKKSAEFDALSRKALDIFTNWSGNHDPLETAPTIFYQFKKELLTNIFKDEMGDKNFSIFEDGFLRHKTLWKILAKQQSPWWDDVSTLSIKETQSSIIEISWQRAIITLKEKFGSDIEKWQWKNRLILEHNHPLGAVKPFNYLFNVGPFAASGGNETINHMNFKLTKDEFKTVVGPSTRRIIDFGDIHHTWGINPTGQSGVVTDKHYADQARMYSEGKFRQQYTLKSDIVERQTGRITMIPNK